MRYLIPTLLLLGCGAPEPPVDAAAYTLHLDAIPEPENGSECGLAGPWTLDVPSSATIDRGDDRRCEWAVYAEGPRWVLDAWCADETTLWLFEGWINRETLTGSVEERIYTAGDPEAVCRAHYDATLETR